MGSLAARSGIHLALGGGNLAHWLVRLFIWHEIFRLFRYLWGIPTYGPFLVALLGLVVIGLIVWRGSRGSRGPVRLRRSRAPSSDSQTGPRSGQGPRDW